MMLQHLRLASQQPFKLLVLIDYIRQVYNLQISLYVEPFSITISSF